MKIQMNASLSLLLKISISIYFFSICSVYGQVSKPHDLEKINAEWKHYNIPVENSEDFESGKSMKAKWVGVPEFKLSDNPVISSSPGYNFFIRKVSKSYANGISFDFSASIADNEYNGQGDVVVYVWLVDKSWVYIKENLIDFSGISAYFLAEDKILESTTMGEVENGYLGLEKLEKDSFIILMIGSYSPVKIDLSLKSSIIENGHFVTHGNKWFD